MAAKGRVQALFIEPGNPWKNGCCESFSEKLREESLDREIFYTLKEAQILTKQWRRGYNTIRPHSSLGYRSAGRLPRPSGPGGNWRQYRDNGWCQCWGAGHWATPDSDNA